MLTKSVLVASRTIFQKRLILQSVIPTVKNLSTTPVCDKNVAVILSGCGV